MGTEKDKHIPHQVSQSRVAFLRGPYLDLCCLPCTSIPNAKFVFFADDTTILSLEEIHFLSWKIEPRKAFTNEITGAVWRVFNHATGFEL